MIWDDITANKEIVEKLKNSVAENRISHAQLFSGKAGWGVLSAAVAYAAEIILAEKGEMAAKRVLDLQHPDLHFSFPVFTSDKVDKFPTSNMYFKEWREFILAHPLANMFDWLEYMEVPKKTGIINVHEAGDINRFLSLNSYEGGHRFCIIWLAETMNTEASNKLLKSIEEPPDKTVFILITEREDMLLPTILSRCQAVKFSRLTDVEVAEYLMKNKEFSQKQIRNAVASANGDLREALLIANSANEEFEERFVDWVRNAFMAKKNVAALRNLVKWSEELSGWPREKQKQFLIYCSEIFRQALILNYRAEDLVYANIEADGFRWDSFAKFIHGANIESILEEINEAAFHIERNANSKIVLLDLSIRLTRQIHKSPV
ncbi:MAG: DNA polymerase III subunit delta' [Moheibacter sp.]